SSDVCSSDLVRYPRFVASLAPIVTPLGHLRVDVEDAAPEVARDVASRLTEAFARGAGHGLLQLGAAEVDTPLTPTFAYWREFAERFVAEICLRPDAAAAT